MRVMIPCLLISFASFSQQSVTVAGSATMAGRVLISSPPALPVAGTSSYYTGTIATNYSAINGIIPIWPAATTPTFQIAFGDASGLAETSGPPMDILLAIEYPVGTFTQGTFSGLTTGSVAGGSITISDPISVTIPSGSVGYIRYQVKRTSGSLGMPSNYLFGNVGGSDLAPNTTSRPLGKFDGVELVVNRTVTDGVTNGTATVTSATANFDSLNDIGQNVTISGTTYTIASVGSTASATMTSPVTGTATGVTFVIAAANKTVSGTISSNFESGYAPMAILGRGSSASIRACLVGDSIESGSGATVAADSYAVQALNQSGVALSLATFIATGIPWINTSMPGEYTTNLTSHHATRFAFLPACSTLNSDIGTNDLGANNPTLVETNLIALWNSELSVAPNIKIWQSTIMPKSTSTDGWLTLSGQAATDVPERNAINSWYRDGAPISSTTGLPVAVGSSTATSNRTAFYSVSGSLVSSSSGPGTHPLRAAFELANSVESSQNSGLWSVDPTNRTTSTCTMTSGSAILTCTGASFAVGDIGKAVAVLTANSGASTLVSTIIARSSGTIVTLANTAASTTAVGTATVIIAGTYGSYTVDGIHPSARGHALAGAAAALNVANW